MWSHVSFLPCLCCPRPSERLGAIWCHWIPLTQSNGGLHVPSFAKIWHSLHTISMFGFEMRGPWSYNAEVLEEQSLIPFHISSYILAQNYIFCVSSAVKIRCFRSRASFLEDIPVKVSRNIGGTCRLLLQDGGISQTCQGPSDREESFGCFSLWTLYYVWTSPCMVY
jgi:hypothetical protein